MAKHPNTQSMLRESLKEMIFVAEYCITYRKDATWEVNQFGGCLGFPAAIMLFCIADTIGSFYEGNGNFKIKINEQDKVIKKDNFQHFYILNSDYYRLNLSEEFIKIIYKRFRSSLVHNLTLSPGYSLSIESDDKPPFEIRENSDPNMVNVHLKPFLKMTQIAIEKFLNKVDAVIPGSKKQGEILLKSFDRKNKNRF